MPQPELITLVVILFLILWGTLLARRQDRRRRSAFIAALNQSTYGTLVLDRQLQADFVRANGFVAWLTPAPEPFHHLLIAFEPRSALSIFNWWHRLRHGETDRIVFIGRLKDVPASEFIWSKGELAGRALTVGDRRQLWQRKQFGIAISEYVVRGPNTPALENIFRSLFARFGPMLQYVHVERSVDFEMPGPLNSDQAHLFVLLNSEKLASQELSALAADVLALGRAAVN